MMWSDWLVLEWALAALGCLVFWLIVAAEIADALHRHKSHQPRRHQRGSR